MSGCRIERKLVDASESLTRAKKEAEKFGSVFEGDVEKGHYHLRTPVGSVVGTYTVTDGTICFMVEKKPTLVPCMVIERVLDEFLRAAPRSARPDH